MDQISTANIEEIQKTFILLQYYHFEESFENLQIILIKWLEKYSASWLPLAVTEAIYQGRLKLVSVEQILTLWERKGAVNVGFDVTFFEFIYPHDIDNYALESQLNTLFSLATKSTHHNNFPQINKEFLNRFQPSIKDSSSLEKLKAFIDTV